MVHLADIRSTWVIVDLWADFIDARQGVHDDHPLLGVCKCLGRDDKRALDLVVLLLNDNSMRNKDEAKAIF